MSGQIILGIESAIAGGSISIRSNDIEVGSWFGDESISRAEELLPNIDRLLRQNQIGLNDIDRIIVSIGPGSFTGIKVGLSTVFGFRAALGTRCLGISSLAALSLLGNGENIATAVPTGRGIICLQIFRDGTEAGPPSLINDAEFDEAYLKTSLSFVLHGSLYDPARFPNAVDGGWNIASHLCTAADSRFATDELRPLFVERKSSNIR